MSDYLSNLIDRSLDRADVVQPRLPSLFEPTPELGQIPMGLEQPAELAMSAIEESLNTSRNPTQRYQKPARSINQNSNHQLNTPNFNSAQPSPSTITQSLSNSTELASSISFAESPQSQNNITEIQTPSLQTQGESPAQQISAQFLATEQTNSATNLSDSVTVSETNNNSSDRSLTAKQPLTADPAINTVKPLSTNNHSGNTPTRAGKSPENTAIIQIQPAKAEHNNQHNTLAQIRSAVQVIAPEASQNAAPPTVIQVNIGRIEVRATTPATPPPSVVNRSNPATMNLEEYLRQRGTGR
jgi:hypothetical protein